jgi:hypothetical protein
MLDMEYVLLAKIAFQMTLQITSEIIYLVFIRRNIAVLWILRKLESFCRKSMRTYGMIKGLSHWVL